MDGKINKNGGTANGSDEPSSSESSRRTDQVTGIQTNLDKLVIDTKGTESTEVNTPSATGSPLIFTPTLGTDNKSNMFKTPTNQQIEISYEQLGLSPSSMKHSVAETLTLLEEDDVWNELDQNKPLNFRVVIFIYGKGFYANLEKKDRIQKIKQILSNDNCKKRLRQIAFTAELYTPTYMPDTNNNTDPFERSNNFIESIYALDKNLKDFRGPGFHGKPFYCTQTSKNCYIPAACNWATLVFRMNGNHRPPLDIGKAARIYDITRTDEFEHRVVQDRGGDSLDLAHKILGIDEIVTDTIRLRSSRMAPRNLKVLSERSLRQKEAQIKTHLNNNRCGLVSKWTSPNQFSARSQMVPENLPMQPGILEFLEPHNPNDKGTFVPFPVDDELEFENRKGLEKKIYDQQVEKRETRITETGDKMELIVGIASTSLHSDGTEEEKKENTDAKEKEVEELAVGSTGGSHSMIMLGYYTKRVEEVKYTKGKKVMMTEKFISMYVIWNWWETMPLVAVPFDYLVSAQCHISFYTEDMPPEPGEGYFCKSDRTTLDAQSAYPLFQENCAESDSDY